MRIAIDTETVGKDLFHGNQVYFFTSCYEDGRQRYWEWEVDPLTRKPTIPEEDVEEVAALIAEADELILQNSKFDYLALKCTNSDFVKYWDWSKVHDTLVAGHLISSNTRHNLTDMALMYIPRCDIRPYEKQLEEVCKAAQRWCRSHFKEWRIASKELPEMPSLMGSKTSKKDRGAEDESGWKADGWLPRAILNYYLKNPPQEPISTRKPTEKQLRRKLDHKSVQDLNDWRPLTGTCEVVNKKYDEYDVDITRSSKWGNPFTHLPTALTTATYQVSTRQEAVEKYREWILHPDQRMLLADLTELDEKRLGCVCKARKPQSRGAVLTDPTSCHGDVLRELLKKWRNPKWDTLPEYSNVDSETTLALWMEQEQIIRQRKLWKIYKTQMKLVPITVAMESRGVTVNGLALDHLTTEFKEASDECESICTNIARSYNYDLKLPKGSARSKNFDDFFFKVLKVPHVYNKKAKTDGPTLNAAAMEQYLVTLPAKSKALTFVKTLLKKRKRDTSLTFMNSYRRFWLPLEDEDGREVTDWFVLHPNYNQCGTDTLRWSCSNPNGTNISRKGMDSICPRCQGDGCAYCKETGTISYNVRYCIGPAPEREFYSCDGQNLELRIPAYKAGEEEMIALFERPNDPPYFGSNHLLNFSAVYPDIWQAELCYQMKDPEWIKKKFKDTFYQWCKNGGFALQYSAGRITADAAFHKNGAYDLLKRRFAKLHGDGGLNQWCIRFAEKHGYIETIPDRSVDPNHGYPLCSRNDFGKVLTTVPLSYYIQGSAGFWMRMAMIRVYDFFEQLNSGQLFQGKKWPGGYYISLQIHDEMLFDVPNGWTMQDKYKRKRSEHQYEYNLPVMKEVQRLMTLGGDDIGVPTPVSCEFHADNWAQGVAI